MESNWHYLMTTIEYMNEKAFLVAELALNRVDCRVMFLVVDDFSTSITEDYAAEFSVTSDESKLNEAYVDA